MKFHYGDKVTPVGPFWTGIFGEVVDYEVSHEMHPDAARNVVLYEVKMPDGNYIEFRETELEKPDPKMPKVAKVTE